MCHVKTKGKQNNFVEKTFLKYKLLFVVLISIVHGVKNYFIRGFRARNEKDVYSDKIYYKYYVLSVFT